MGSIGDDLCRMFCLGGNFGKVELKSFPREVNGVAHSIAKFSYDHELSCNWVDEPPS